MKRITKRIISMVLMISLVFMFVSCSNGGTTRTNGYFKYKINKETREVMIIGLSKKGQEQSTIVIPTTLKGKRVANIGHLVAFGDGSNWEAEFNSEKLETIYFHSSLEKYDLNYVFFKDMPNVKKSILG